MALPIIRPALALAAVFAVSGCYSDGYGYDRPSYAYNSGYSQGGYYGWYGDYYYPGNGYYVYDRRGGSHRWNDGQRRYWEARRDRRNDRANWSGYHQLRDNRQEWRNDRRDGREYRRDDRREWRDDRRDDRRDRRDERPRRPR